MKPILQNRMIAKFVMPMLAALGIIADAAAQGAAGGYIQIRQRAISEEISPDFSYNITGDVTTTFELNDKSDAVKVIFDVSGDGDGGFFSIADTTETWSVNPGLIHYKPGGTSQWSNLSVQALSVAGINNGGYLSLVRTATTTSALKNTADEIRYRADAASPEIDITYNLTGSRFMAVASNYDDMLYVLVRTDVNSGTIYKKSISDLNWTSTGITDVQSLTAIPEENKLVYAKSVAPVKNQIYISNDDNTSIVPWGNPIPLWDSDMIERIALTVNAAGDIELWALSVALIYKASAPGSWAKESGINDMRLLASSGSKILYAMLRDRASVNIPWRFFTRTQNGVYLDDERVRTNEKSNTLTLPVAPGTYTITQNAITGWQLTDIAIYETTMAGSSTDMSEKQVTVTVSANEVVVVEFENQFITTPTALSAVCGDLSFTEDFSSYANGDWGHPVEGMISYHKATGNFGYGHYAVVPTSAVLSYGDTIFDHTSGDATGSLLLIDATFEPGIFYRRRFTGLLPGAHYSMGAWISNFNPRASDKPNVSFEVYSLDGTLLASANSGNILSSQWHNFNLVYVSDGTDVEIVLRNNKFGTAGNDLAIDDISFSFTPPDPQAVVSSACTASGTTTTLTVTAPMAIGGGLGYEYSIDGIHWQTSAIFEDLPIGSYTLSARYAEMEGCVSTMLVEIDNSCILISGHVWNDGDGDALKAVSGEPYLNLGTTATDGLWANLVNASGEVVSSVPVNADGTYTLYTDQSGTHAVILTNEEQPLGRSLTVASALPENWVHTGTNTDGVANTSNRTGMITGIVVGTADIENLDFGMQQLPDSDNIFYTLSTAPSAGYEFYLDGLSGNPPLMSGSDAEDGAYSGNIGTVNNPLGVVITSLPTHGELWYFGFGVPVLVNRYDIDNATLFDDPSFFVILFTDSGSYTSTVFEYAYMDASGSLDPTPATYTLDWGIPMAVTMLSFEVEQRHHSVLLQWITTSEEGNDGFDIERSENGNNWTAIGFLKSAAISGSSHQSLSYQFVDDKPYSGNNYYRLKQKGINSSYQYSDVRLLRLETFNNLEIKPNPATDVLSISGLTRGKHQLVLVNALGQVLINISVSDEPVCKLDLSALNAGLYYLSVTNENGMIHNHKIVKQ